MRNIRRFGHFISLMTNRSLISSSVVNNLNRTYTCNLKNYTTLKSNQMMKDEKVLVNAVLSRNIYLASVCNAKGKDRGGKEKKKPKASKIDLRELSETLDTDDLTSRMREAIDNMKLDFVKNLTLRSTTGSLEQIPITLDGKDYQLQELAQIARKPKVMVLNVSTFPTAIPHILKAIQKSGLNINPQQDGTTIFLPIPKVTKEHRENLSKNAKAIFIRHRDEIKDIRNKAVKSLKKKNDISEDAIRRMQSQVEAICDKFIKEAELVLETKQNELLGSGD